MNVHVHRESATIYQFPVVLRRPAADHREGSGAVVERLPQRVSYAGDCWYHEAAIDEGACQADA